MIVSTSSSPPDNTETPLPRPESFTVGPYRVYLRPHLTEFLAHAAAHFDLAVCTASSADYAAVVVPATFGAGHRLEFVWARPRCTVRYDPETRDRYFVKDLKKVRARGYALEHVLVVDDTPQKHQRNYGNLVTVHRSSLRRRPGRRRARPPRSVPRDARRRRQRPNDREARLAET